MAVLERVRGVVDVRRRQWRRRTAVQWCGGVKGSFDGWPPMAVERRRVGGVGESVGGSAVAPENLGSVQIVLKVSPVCVLCLASSAQPGCAAVLPRVAPTPLRCLLSRRRPKTPTSLPETPRLTAIVVGSFLTVLHPPIRNRLLSSAAALACSVHDLVEARGEASRHLLDNAAAAVGTAVGGDRAVSPLVSAVLTRLLSRLPPAVRLSDLLLLPPSSLSRPPPSSTRCDGAVDGAPPPSAAGGRASPACVVRAARGASASVAASADVGLHPSAEGDGGAPPRPSSVPTAAALPSAVLSRAATALSPPFPLHYQQPPRDPPMSSFLPSVVPLGPSLSPWDVPPSSLESATSHVSSLDSLPLSQRSPSTSSPPIPLFAAPPSASPPSPTFTATSPSQSQDLGGYSPSPSQFSQSNVPVPTFLASISRASTIPSSSLMSLPPPPSPCPPSAPPQRVNSIEGAAPCALCSLPLTVNVSGQPGPCPPPCRCMECRQQFHGHCARLKEMDGEDICLLCRQQRRQQRKKKKKEKKERRKKERVEDRETDHSGDSEDDDAASVDGEQKRVDAQSVSRVQNAKRASSHPPPLSLPSSSTTTPGPSAPPSTRSATSADPASAHLESFSDFLTAFVESNSPDAQQSIPYIDRQSSTPLDWSTLTSRLRMCAQKHVLAQVDVELLSRLLPFLLTSMEAASVCTLLHPTQPFDGERLQMVLKGLDGALMTLLVMTQKGIERTLMREELLDGLIASLVHTIKRNILPLYDPALRERHSKPSLDDNKAPVENDDIEEEDINEDEELDSDVTPSKKKVPAKGKKRVTAPPQAEVSAAEAMWWKGAESGMKDAVKKVELLLSLLDLYIRSETTRDQQILPLIDLGFLVLTADHCTRLQLSIVPLVVAIFLHGDEGRRHSIIDSVVTAFRASAVKKMQRSFALQHPLSSSFRSHFAPMATGAGAGTASTSGAKIQLLVGLMMQLLHSISGASLHHEDLQAQHDQVLHQLVQSSASSPPPSSLLLETKTFIGSIKDAYHATQKAAWYFVQSFLDRLQPTSTGSLQFKHTQAMTRAVLDDLLLVLFLPEWPAAEQLLHCFIVRMCMVLDRPKGVDKTVALNSDRLHLLCILCLGLICQQVKAHDVQMQRAPVTIRPQRTIDSSQPATPHADSEITDCICGYRKVGRGQWTPTEEGEDGAVAAEPDVNETELHSLYVDCDSCHVWYHGECVGFRTQEEVEAEGSWVCESCLLRMAVTQQKQRMERQILSRRSGDFTFDEEKCVDPSTSKASSPPADPLTSSDPPSELESGPKASEAVLKQLLMNYLNELSKINVKDPLVFARQFHLAQWLAAAVKEDERHQQMMVDSGETPTPPVPPISLTTNADVRLCLVNWALPSATVGTKEVATTLAREGQFRVSRQLCSQRELIGSIPLMLDKLLVKCTDPQPQFRAKAVSAVSGVVKVDPSILEHPSVKRALMERVMDPSTSTREAVIDLIGSQVKYQPSIFTEYYHTILDRSNDVGISVRKRVVKLIHEFLLHPQLRGREDVQSAYRTMVGHLIARLRDEDTVQRLVRDTFYHLWFDEKDDAIMSRKSSKTFLQRRQDDSTASPSSYSPAFQELVQRIIECVGEVTSLQSGLDNLIDIVQTLMEQQDTGKRGPKSKGKAVPLPSVPQDVDAALDPKRPHSIRAICTDVCGCIVEQLVHHKEDSALTSGPTPAPAFSSFLLSALSTLHFFSRLHPPFLVEHAYTLQPYLKHSLDRLLQPAVERLIEIFTEILPLIRHPTALFLAHMQKDLLRVILQSTSLSLVASAIPCLVVLTSITDKRDVLMTLVVRFHRFLVEHSPTSQVQVVQEEGNVIRSLLALALLLKHFPEDDYTKLSISGTPTVDAVFVLYRKYIDLCPLKCQIFGIRGLIALFTRKPTLITQSESALSRALGAEVSPELQITTLQSLRTFLQSEDARLQRAQKIDQQRTKAQRKRERGGTAGEEDGDAEEVESTAEDDAMMVEDLGAVHSLHDFHGTKKAWLDSRIEVSDFLPALITLCEHHVYALCFSPMPAVRGEALAFINIFLHQAVTNPADAMPTVVALLFDRSVEPPNATQALSVLQSLSEKKKEYLHFIEQRFLQGVRLGHSLQLAVWASEYDPLQQGGAASGGVGVSYDSVAQLYSLLKKSSAQRKQIASSLINDVMASQLIGTALQPQLTPATAPTRTTSLSSPALVRSPATPSHAPRVSPSSSPASTSSMSTTGGADASPSRAKFGLLCFLAALIVHLPFDDDEPLHYLHHLNKIIHTKGTALLATIDDCVQALRGMEEQIHSDPSVHPSLLPAITQRLTELSSLCDRAMAMSVLMQLKASLVGLYQVDGRYDEWNIHKATVKAAVKLSRRSDVAVPISFIHFPWLSDDDERKGPTSFVQLSPSTAKPSPVKRTPSKGGRGGKGAQHSRQGSVVGEGEGGQPIGLIPSALLRQSEFFNEMMNGATVQMFQQSAAPLSRGRGRGRGKRSSRAVSGDDGDSGDDRPLQTVGSASVQSSPSKTPTTRKSHKKRKSLAFGLNDRLILQEGQGGGEGEEEGEAQEAEEDEDDGDWEDESRSKARKATKARKGKGKGKSPAKS